METVQYLLSQLEDFHGLINEAIEEKEWDRLNDLLVTRQDRLDDLFSLEISESERETVIRMMTTMQKTDAKILAEVQTQKENLQKQLSTFVHDRKSVQAYLSE